MPIKDFISGVVRKSQLQATVDRLLESSTFNAGFFFRLILSAAIATLGLLGNNMSIVIGAMVIAPLLTPLLCFSLGGLSFKPKMIEYGFVAIVIGSVLGILTGAGLVFVLGKTQIPGELIQLYKFHGYDFLIIALLTGMAGAYASLSSDSSEQIIGVAIAAALVPPLAFAGIALGVGEYGLFRETVVLYIQNLIGTSLGAMLVYASFMTRNKVNPGAIKEKEVK